MDRIFLVILVTLLSVGSCGYGCATGCGENYSDGERVGVVQKFSQKGLSIKSWEGDLNVNPGGAIVDIWRFSVQDEAVVKQIQQAQRSGNRVALHYKEWFHSPISIDTDYVVTSVTLAKVEQ